MKNRIHDAEVGCKILVLKVLVVGRASTSPYFI